MERKTQFESGEDVQTYFANQTELWDNPKPQPPDHYPSRPWPDAYDVAA